MKIRPFLGMNAIAKEGLGTLSDYYGGMRAKAVPKKEKTK